MEKLVGSEKEEYLLVLYVILKVYTERAETFVLAFLLWKNNWTLPDRIFNSIINTNIVSKISKEARRYGDFIFEGAENENI